MAVSAKLFGKFFLSLGNKEMDMNSDTFKCMLTTSTYTPDQDVHDYKDDVTNEVSGTGYSAGGVTIATPTHTYTGATNVYMWDAGDAVWTTASFTARYAVIYDNTPSTDATRPLVGYVDFGADQTVNSADFTIQWNASGIFTITVS